MRILLKMKKQDARVELMQPQWYIASRYTLKPSIAYDPWRGMSDQSQSNHKPVCRIASQRGASVDRRAPLLSWFFLSLARSESRCSLHLWLRGKKIPNPRFGEQVARVGRIRFQFVSQPVDVHLEQVALTNICYSPGLL